MIDYKGILFKIKLGQKFHRKGRNLLLLIYGPVCKVHTYALNFS